MLLVWAYYITTMVFCWANLFPSFAQPASPEAVSSPIQEGEEEADPKEEPSQVEANVPGASEKPPDPDLGSTDLPKLSCCHKI